MEFKVRDRIIIKNKTNLKQNALWRGLYVIKDVYDFHVVFQKGVVTDKVNKRNIQLFERGESVVTDTTP